MDKIDFSLTLDNEGIYDIAIGDDGDAASTAGFATSLLLTLGVDARVTASEIRNPYLRRGFIGDEFIEGFVHGSKLWLVDQARVNTNTRNLSVGYARDSLQWLINEGRATAVNVTGRITGSSVVLLIDIISTNNNVQSWSYDLWKNTIEELQ